MIFSNSRSEIYWILSKLMNQFDIMILKKIMNEKIKLEDKEIYEWYIEQGLRLSKLRIKNHKKIYIDKILFNPYGGDYHSLKNHHIKVFHLKILFETFLYKGFILNYENNEYSIPLLSEKIQTLNDFIKDHGVYEIYGKTFQYKSFKLTDLVGNPCVRSIIRKKVNNHIIYEYKTMAISENQFIDPIERLPRGNH